MAPLNWGLGHATRCIPLITELAGNGCDVVIAAPEGPVKELLQEAFPLMEFALLPAYQIRYSRKKIWLPVKLLWQIPRLLRTIRQENRWLQQAVRELRPDAVISDNRFGLWHTGLPAVYITHQLAPMAPGSVGRWLARRIHYRCINRFAECWVPDTEKAPGLAGALSHPATKPAIPLQYLGPLSRFEKKAPAETQYSLLVLISGPEPQRSLFEDLLLKELNTYSGRTLLVRGLPGSASPPPAMPAHIEVVNHLPAPQLALAIQQSALVVARSGYTTVMDLVQLQQKAVLVPTPGQTEQEYLARHLQQQGLFAALPQQQFSLPLALKLAEDLQAPPLALDTQQYKEVIARWLQTI